MYILSLILVGIVAAEHMFILYMEMFAWESLGRKVFRGALADELFSKTKVMAANQGLYNGFLAAGLVWTYFISNLEWQTNVTIFFLGCVIVAGTFGAMTASRKIFITQAMPAIVALCVVLMR